MSCRSCLPPAPCIPPSKWCLIPTTSTAFQRCSFKMMSLHFKAFLSLLSMKPTTERACMKPYNDGGVVRLQTWRSWKWFGVTLRKPLLNEHQAPSRRSVSLVQGGLVRLTVPTETRYLQESNGIVAVCKASMRGSTQTSARGASHAGCCPQNGRQHPTAPNALCAQEQHHHDILSRVHDGKECVTCAGLLGRHHPLAQQGCES